MAQYVRYQGGQVLIDGLSIDDIQDEIWGEMKISDMVEQGDSGCSPTHDRRRESLIGFLMNCGYELDRDDDRGFANEYTMILRDTGEEVENSEEDAEAWADDFLYDGDPTTEAYVRFRFECGYADDDEDCE